MELKDINTLLHGGTSGLGFAWNTGLSPAGDYSVIAETSVGGQVVSSKTATFGINSSLIFAGSVNVTTRINGQDQEHCERSGNDRDLQQRS